MIASKKIDMASPIIRCFPLNDWSKAFSLVKEGEATKALLIPQNNQPIWRRSFYFGGSKKYDLVGS